MNSLENYKFVGEFDDETKKKVLEEFKHLTKVYENETIKPLKDTISTYQAKEVREKLTGKINPELLEDFIKVKGITNEMTDDELKKVIKESSAYQIKVDNGSIDKNENKQLKDKLSGNKDEEEFNEFDPLGIF